MIKVDLSGAAGFFDPAGPDYAAAAQAHRTLLEHTGAGADFPAGSICRGVCKTANSSRS